MGTVMAALPEQPPTANSTMLFSRRKGDTLWQICTTRSHNPAAMENPHPTSRDRHTEHEGNPSWRQETPVCDSTSVRFKGRRGAGRRRASSTEPTGFGERAVRRASMLGTLHQSGLLFSGSGGPWDFAYWHLPGAGRCYAGNRVLLAGNREARTGLAAENSESGHPHWPLFS